MAAPDNPPALPELSAEQTAETLKGWYLLRGYSADFDPLSTIMDEPKDKAIATMERVHPTRGIGKADANGHRDQKEYYQLRTEADSWLRDNSDAAKDRQNPIFFALTNDPETVRRAMNTEGGKVMMMPLIEADLSKFSITFDDSMGNYRTTVLDTKNTGINGEFLPDKSPVHGTVMNAQQFAAAIAAHGDTDATGGKRNIEAQYWSTEPLAKAQIFDYDPALPKPQRPATPETVKLYHGTSEAHLAGILQNGFEPRYMTARERMRSVMEGVAGEGNVSDADVDKVVAQRQRRALEAGNVVYTSPHRDISEGYALRYNGSGGELSHQVQGLMLSNGPGRFDGARPVLLELDVDGQSLKTEMHDYEVLVRAGKGITVKSVTFGKDTGAGFTFEGQEAMPPAEALRHIAPQFAEAQPKRDADPAQQKILKTLDDFTHDNGAVGRTGTMYVAETTMTDADGNKIRVKIPDPDFVPQAQERFGQYGFNGVAAVYTMPHDLIPAEAQAYITVLDIREQRGQISKAEKDAGLKSFLADMENANPALKALDFDRNDPAKVSDVLRGAINAYSPENLQHHVSPTRADGYDALKKHPSVAISRGADIDLSPETLKGIGAEMERKLAAFDAEHNAKPAASKPNTDFNTAAKPPAGKPDAPQTSVTRAVVDTPATPKASAPDIHPAPQGGHGTSGHGHIQAKAGRAQGAAQVAVDVANGNYGAAATGAATEIALTAKTYEAAAELTSAIKPVAKAIGFVGKRIPLIGAVVTTGFVLWEAGSAAINGEYGKAGAALAAGGAEAVGNLAGFGVGDLARETVREAVVFTAGEQYAPNKSGLRQLGEGAYALGSKFAAGQQPEQKTTTTATATITTTRPKTPGM